MANLVPAGFHSLPLPIVQLSLAAVLKCGQSFRWTAFPLSESQDSFTANSPTHEYRFCLRDRVVCLRQSFDTIFYRSVFPDNSLDDATARVRQAETLAWLRDYFQLDVDLSRLYDHWSDCDPVFHNLRSRFGGIRILRQDPWENLVSFICSSNNNISRISKMVQALCRHFSPRIVSLPDPPLVGKPPSSSNGPIYQSYHPFPPPSILAKPDVGQTLRSLGFGYRAEFIQRTAEMLVTAHGCSENTADSYEASEKWLKTLRDMSTAQAREQLLKFIGVGRKVADCILLMSLDKREVIPVDTHVHQIALKHYGFRSGTKVMTMTPKLYEEVNEKLTSIWGDHAGWAHSVLFTADLKSFSTHGLPTPSPSPVKRSTPSKRRKAPVEPLTPISLQKRKYSADISGSKLLADGHIVSKTFSSPAERAKRRRQARPEDIVPIRY